MTLELNAGKLLGLFTPIWVLLALSLAVNWTDWQDKPQTLAWVGGLPFAATALLWSFGRRRWRLELTPTALVHHTLGRSERFEWDRMGEIAVDGVPGLDLISPSTLRFAYSGGGAIGRRLLCVFGDGGARRLKRKIDDYRRLHVGRRK
ncbi:MAG: hypothetical protein ACOVMO_06330 [Caulobacter sp.]